MKVVSATVFFVVKWNVSGGVYVVDQSSDRSPYSVHLSNAKRWKTRKNAERWLSLKDPTWASNCTVEEHQS
jgi:hypothetical protein